MTGKREDLIDAMWRLISAGYSLSLSYDELVVKRDNATVARVPIDFHPDWWSVANLDVENILTRRP